MYKIYLDTSVYIKFFKREYGSVNIKKIIEFAKTGKCRVYLSFWTLNESNQQLIENAIKKT